MISDYPERGGSRMEILKPFRRTLKVDSGGFSIWKVYVGCRPHIRIRPSVLAGSPPSLTSDRFNFQEKHLLLLTPNSYNFNSNKTCFNERIRMTGNVVTRQVDWTGLRAAPSPTLPFSRGCPLHSGHSSGEPALGVTQGFI